MRIERIEADAISIPLNRDCGAGTYHVTRRCTVITRIYAQGLVAEAGQCEITSQGVRRIGKVGLGYSEAFRTRTFRHYKTEERS